MPEIRFIEVEEIEAKLSAPLLPELVDEYYRFGTLLLSEVHAASAQVDAKLTTILGLSIGLLVSLLFGAAMKQFALTKVIADVAAAIALSALVVAIYGAMARAWRLPSERDWFKSELTEASDLKKYHIVSMLAEHQQHVKLVAKKGSCLQVAQALLVASAIAFLVALVNASLS